MGARRFPFPYRADAPSLSPEAEAAAHLEEMVELLLFTSPGERLRRPELGSGLRELIFASQSEEMATATEFMLRSSLQQWLGDRLQLEALQVRAEEERLIIELRYRVAGGEPRTAQFEGVLS